MRMIIVDSFNRGIHPPALPAKKGPYVYSRRMYCTYIHRKAREAASSGVLRKFRGLGEAEDMPDLPADISFQASLHVCSLFGL